jgi:hypothetical protein
MFKENYDHCESDGSWPLNRSYMFRIENDNFHNGIMGRGSMDEAGNPIVRGEMRRPISLIFGDLKEQINVKMNLEIDHSEIHAEKIWRGETTLQGFSFQQGSSTSVTYVESPITDEENFLYKRNKQTIEKQDQVPFSWNVHATWVTSTKFSLDQNGQRRFTHIELDSFGNLNEVSITEMDLNHNATKRQFDNWNNPDLLRSLIAEGKTHFYTVQVRLKCGPNPRYTKLKKRMRVTEEQMEKFHIRLPKGIAGGK